MYLQVPKDKEREREREIDLGSSHLLVLPSLYRAKLVHVRYGLILPLGLNDTDLWMGEVQVLGGRRSEVIAILVAWCILYPVSCRSTCKCRSHDDDRAYNPPGIVLTYTGH